MEAPAIIRNARGHRHSEGLKRRRMGVLWGRRISPCGPASLPSARCSGRWRPGEAERPLLALTDTGCAFCAGQCLKPHCLSFPTANFSPSVTVFPSNFKAMDKQRSYGWDRSITACYEDKNSLSWGMACFFFLLRRCLSSVSASSGNGSKSGA